MAQPTTNTETTDRFFDGATESFRSAMDAGIKFQQDFFNKMTSGLTRCDDVADRFETFTNDTMNFVRKNAEQAQKAFDDNCRNGIDTVRKASELSRAEDKDVFVRSGDFWNCTFDAMRGNVEVAARTTTQAFDNWSNFIGNCTKKNTRKAAK